MPTPPDAAAVTPEQLAGLLDRHGGALVLFAAQWCGEPEDCVQEAFVDLARQSEAPDSPAAWLYAVVKRRALSTARSGGRRRDRERRAIERRLAGGSTAGDPAEATELLDLLDQLDATQREVVVLRLWGGLTLAEIGQAVGVSTATAGRRYEQAIAQLKRAWGPDTATSREGLRK